jgi:hypothetical protein
MEFRRLNIMVVLILALAESAVLGQDYIFVDPVLSRDSGLTCMGKSATDESRLGRWPYEGVENLSASNAEVYCPLNRRNTAAYGQSPNSDKFLLKKLTIYAYSSSNSGVVSCRVFAYSAASDTVYESARKYVCNTDGGCSSPPSAGHYGYKPLVFDYPFGAAVTSNKSILNIGYRCTLPGNGGTSGATSIIGSEGDFQSESSNTP